MHGSAAEGRGCRTPEFQVSKCETALEGELVLKKKSGTPSARLLRGSGQVIIQRGQLSRTIRAGL